MKEGWDAPITDWIGEMKVASNAEIKAIAKAGFEKIKERTPVQTGELQAAWIYDEAMEQGLIEIVIENKKEYVLMVEYGTVYTGGRYMLERTINEIVEGGL
jgi:hypothetical protein